MKKFAVFLTIAIALVGGMSPAWADDVVSTAEHAGSLKKFVDAIKATDLPTTLKQPGPFTIFAPSDSAIAKLPKGTWEALLRDKAKLEKTIALHIVPGKFLVSEVKPGAMETMAGQAIRLTSDNGMVTVNGASITQSDMQADNGVVHEIDQVILME